MVGIGVGDDADKYFERFADNCWIAISIITADKPTKHAIVIESKTQLHEIENFINLQIYFVKHPRKQQYNFVHVHCGFGGSRRKFILEEVINHFLSKWLELFSESHH